MRVRQSARRAIDRTVTALLLMLVIPAATTAEVERIRVGVYSNPPKVFLDRDGVPSGFWSDLTRAIAEREGWRIEWVHGTWDESLDRLADNRIDVLVDVAVTGERRERFAFGNETVHVSWSQMYATPGVRIETIPDLQGKRIGALAHSINLKGPEGLQTLLEKFSVEATVISMPDYGAVFAALHNGEIDAGVTNREFGNWMQSEFDVVSTPILFQPADLRYAFTIDGPLTAELRRRFDARVAALKADPDSRYHEAQATWLGPERRGPREILPAWLAWVIAALLGATVLLAGGVAVVDMRVRARTRTLREQQAQLQRHERMLAESQRIARVGSWRLDVVHDRLEWSRETYRIVGVSAQSFTPTVDAFLGFVHPEDLAALHAVRTPALDGVRPYDIAFRIIRPDGDVRHVQERGEADSDASGKVLSLSGTLQDITEVMEAKALMQAQEDGLRRSHDHLADLLESRRALIDSLPAHIALLDRVGTILDVNDQWRSFGAQNAFSGSDFGVGSNYLAVCLGATGAGAEQAAEVAYGIRDVLEGRRKVFALEYPCHSPEHYRWFRVMVNRLMPGDELGQQHGAVVMHVDITERKLAEQELNRLAYQDPLTDLPSRNGFSLQASELLERIGWQPAAIVVVIDVVGLRDINDAHGYDTGDQLLISLGGRLREQAGEHGQAGRTGGDEFVLLLLPVPGQAPEQRLASVSAALSAPFVLAGAELEIGVRIGYTYLAQQPRAAESLLREAELALFQNRLEPGQSWVAYTPELDRVTHRRIELTRELRKALEEHQFEMHFQPKVDLQSGRIFSCEALLRWRHPQRGLQPPGLFIPIAEKSQLIGPLGEWIVRDTCRQLRAWRDAGLHTVPVSINVSLVQLISGDFPRTVRKALDEVGLAPDALTLEITESVFERQSASLLAQLVELHEMGVQLSLDDFGTGYSSLLYLQKYPFDEIKIDQGFVRHIRDDDYSREIVGLVMGLARAFGANVVAEGIESSEIRDALLELGCRTGQGYYFSMPLEAHDLARLLDGKTRLPLREGGG